MVADQSAIALRTHTQWDDKHQPNVHRLLLLLIVWRVVIGIVPFTVICAAGNSTVL